MHSRPWTQQKVRDISLVPKVPCRRIDAQKRCVCVLRNAVWEGESSSSAVCAWGCTSYLAQLGLNVSWWQLDEGGNVLHLYTTVGLNQPHQVLLQQRSCVHMCLCVCRVETWW